MLLRTIKKSQWEHVCAQITTCGKSAPLSLQYDFNLRCNDTDYILKVQPTRKRNLAVLQAVGIAPDDSAADGKKYELIEDNLMLSALLEIILFQGDAERSA